MRCVVLGQIPLDAPLSACVSPAGVCSCLVPGGRSLIGPGGLPYQLWRPFSDLGGSPSLPLPGGGAVCGGGLCGGRRGRGPLPPCFVLRLLLVFVPGLLGGDPSLVVGGGLWVWFSVLSCCGSLMVAVACSGRGLLGPRSPPFVFFFAVLVVSASPSSVACLFPGGGVCRRVWDVFFSDASVAAWSWCVAFSGWASLGSSVWSLGVLLAGPVGVAHGVAWLGGLPRQVQLVRGFAVLWLSFLLFSVLPCLGVCTCWVVSTARLFPVCRWVGFPPLPVVFCSSWGRGFACSSPCPTRAGACTSR